MKRRYIGRNVRRFRDPFLVIGAGRFVADVYLPSMLYAAILMAAPRT